MRAFPVLPPSRRPTGPVIAFVATPSTTTPVAGVAVTWSTNAGDLGTPVSYSWDFGDGTREVTGATPSHYWVTTGSYTVTCTVVMDDANTYTDTQVITPQTTEEVTLTNKPYQEGTAKPNVDDASWTKNNCTVTANFAIAPDGTTTAAKVDVGSSTSFRYIQRTETLSSGQPYSLVFYVKYVDIQYFNVNFYSSNSACVLFDLVNGTVETVLALAPLLRAKIDDVGSGWYRCSVSTTIGTSTCYPTLYPTTSSTLAGDGSPSPSSFTGANETVLLWGIQLISGIDDYTTDTHYLGDVQTPAPTLNVDSPATTVGQTLLNYSAFDADVDDTNYASRGWYSFVGNPIVYTRSVGAKLVTTTGVGTHGVSTGQNWIALWDNATGLGNAQQVGAWFYFDRAPANDVMLVGQQYQSFGYKYAISLGSDMKLYWNENSSPITEIRATPVPLNTWFWVGLAVSAEGTTIVKMFKLIGEATETLTGGSTTVWATNNAFGCVGIFNPAYNIDFIGRIAYATRHQLSSIANAGYPNEVVPPQEVPYIYQVEPSAGDDDNDGITAPWQTLTKLNTMLGIIGVISTYDDADYGLGAVVEIDTSIEPFDVGTTGIACYRDHIHLRAPDGNTWIEIKPYVDIPSGDWTATGGHADTYQIACTFEDTQLFNKTDLEMYLKVADLAALDAAAPNAFTWVTNVLYLKSATNPASNDKEYLYTRFRNGTSGIGEPAVGMCGDMWLVDNIRCWYTAYDNNGSYCIGDIPNTYGSSLPGSGKIGPFDTRYTDKHSVCLTQNTTDATIIIDGGRGEQGLSQLFTSYMSTGSGNTHIWRNITVTKDWLRSNMPEGDYGFGAFYSHGGGPGRYDLVWLDTCDFGLCDVMLEVAAIELRVTDSTLGMLTSQRFISATNSEFYLQGFSYGHSINTGYGFSFTNCVIRGSDSPRYYNLQASDVIACDYNTYYFGASAVFAEAFDAGGGPADYTFAQWQALGYDTHSTRLDP